MFEIGCRILKDHTREKEHMQLYVTGSMEKEQKQIQFHPGC